MIEPAGLDLDCPSLKTQTGIAEAHQCDQAQGYYFSRPVVAPQFAELLETQGARSSHSSLDPFARAARAASVNPS